MPGESQKSKSVGSTPPPPPHTPSFLLQQPAWGEIRVRSWSPPPNPVSGCSYPPVCAIELGGLQEESRWLAQALKAALKEWKKEAAARGGVWEQERVIGFNHPARSAPARSPTHTCSQLPAKAELPSAHKRALGFCTKSPQPLGGENLLL